MQTGQSELLAVEVRCRVSGGGFDVPSELWDQLKALGNGHLANHLMAHNLAQDRWIKIVESSL